jgi:hypothetical protein
MQARNFVRLMLGVVLLAGGTLASAKDELPDITHDGLERVQSKNVAVVYRLPGADFSQYKRVAIADCAVAFRKNWQRDHSSGGTRVSTREMERIKKEIADEFRIVFSDELQNNGGYEVVSELGEDVLLLRPAIVNLDVAAPDTMSAGRSRSYATTAGEMTLYLELYDGFSGEILGRVVDRQRGRDPGFMQWQTSVSNKAEADRMLRKWAVLARKGLDRVHAGKQSAAGQAPQ